MANPKINISKTTTPRDNNNHDIRDERVNAIEKFFNGICVDNKSFDVKASFNELQKYIGKYDRILYSPISNVIYNCYDHNAADEAEKKIGTIISNLDNLVSYTVSSDFNTRRSQTKKSESIKQLDDTKKAILKIWDHVNLAQQQYSVLKQSDEEYQQKFEKLISSYREEMTKDMNTQLLTMVSIFTALAFLVFGGISSLDNIFSTHGIPLLKLMCVGAIWGLCILNLIFIFLFCVGKMTKFDFMPADDPNATIFQRYSVVWWTDFMLAIILVISLWAYYIRQNGIDNWLTKICANNQAASSIIGTIVLLIVFIVAGIWLSKKTKGK